MAKDKLSQYDNSAANNTDVGEVSEVGHDFPERVIQIAWDHHALGQVDPADATEAVDAVAVDNLKLDGNTLSSTDTNGNVIVSPNGTGNVEIAKDLQLNGTTNNWTIEVDGSDHLIFKYNGTAVLKIEDNGHITSGNDVTAFGTV